MIRLSKMADYGIVLLSYMGQMAGSSPITSRELADASSLPLPTVSKILKILSREGLLISHRGTKGGYSLALPMKAISVIDVIKTLEGPIALTACNHASEGICDLESRCPAKSNWQRINDVVIKALSNLSLLDMKQPEIRPLVKPQSPKPTGLQERMLP